jgi:glycopeptide antibiotics resistance protein
MKKAALLGNIVLVILSILVVLIATLYPFSFYWTENVSRKLIIDSFDNVSSFQDVVNNILLFMPLGFSCTALLERGRMKFATKFLTVTLISAALSSTVETLQVFLPVRTPTPADIINNTISGVIGIICFYIWDSKSFKQIFLSIENSRASNSVKKITILFFVYILFAFLITIPWQSTTHLSNWNLNYPLLLGNEKTGDRPWYGYISELHISDRALSQGELAKIFEQPNNFDSIQDSLMGSYQFTGKRNYQDNTGQLPELSSQGQLPNIEDPKGVALSSKHWLETTDPVTSLSRRISETSQLTIITTVATDDTNQIGPARIISISGDVFRRNFTLGQQGNDLDLRIRTPLTGQTAADLELRVDNVFADTKPHYIITTYSKGNIHIYVDRLQNFYALNLLELIPNEQKIFYYGLTFIPFGLCLALLTILVKKRFSFYRWLVASGIILPSVILESILVIDIGKSISLTNLLLGIFFTGGTMVMLRLRARALLKKAVL